MVLLFIFNSSDNEEHIGENSVWKFVIEQTWWLGENNLIYV